jgi:hypothetical protein
LLANAEFLLENPPELLVESCENPPEPLKALLTDPEFVTPLLEFVPEPLEEF